MTGIGGQHHRNLHKINTNVIVEISEFLQIYLGFENKSNMELSAKEETE